VQGQHLEHEAGAFREGARSAAVEAWMEEGELDHERMMLGRKLRPCHSPRRAGPGSGLCEVATTELGPSVQHEDLGPPRTELKSRIGKMQL
jgi:hypothetical protein